MTTNTFLRDLERGGKAEKKIIRLFTAAGFPSQVEQNRAKRSKWDVTSDYGQTAITVEVKLDEYEQRSGNVAIETHNPRLGKPSGLMATEAFLWAHVLKDGATWVTTVESLKDYVDKTKPKRIIECGGDDNATLKLYPSSQILPAVFTRIDTMDEDELQDFIITIWESN